MCGRDDPNSWPRVGTVVYRGPDDEQELVDTILGCLRTHAEHLMRSLNPQLKVASAYERILETGKFEYCTEDFKYEDFKDDNWFRVLIFEDAVTVERLKTIKRRT